MLDVHDESGASAVEYGLLLAGVAAIIVAAIWFFGGMVDGVFRDSCDTVNSHVQDAATNCT